MEDKLLSTMLSRAQGIGPDPRPTSLESIREVYGDISMPMSIVGAGKKLEPLMIELYKQRLKADPSLYAHPGLQQIPEFQEAFKLLNPAKKILGAGQEKLQSWTNALKGVRTNVASSPEEALEAARAAAPMTGQRTATYADMRAAKGIPQTRGRPNRYDESFVKRIQEEAASWPFSQERLARHFGISRSTLQYLLTRFK